MIKNTFVKTLPFLKKEWFRLLVLIISVLVISEIFIYLNNQSALASNERAEKIRLENDVKNKEYTAKRRNDCFDIYNKEKDNWNNIKGDRYDEKEDICYVVYKDNTNTKTENQCLDLWSDKSGKLYTFPGALRGYSLCIAHEFETAF